MGSSVIVILGLMEIHILLQIIQPVLLFLILLDVILITWVSYFSINVNASVTDELCLNYDDGRIVG